MAIQLQTIHSFGMYEYIYDKLFSDNEIINICNTGSYGRIREAYIQQAPRAIWHQGKIQAIGFKLWYYHTGIVFTFNHCIKLHVVYQRIKHEYSF